jgi:hypothetical protein
MMRLPRESRGGQRPDVADTAQTKMPAGQAAGILSVYAGLAYGDGFEVDGFNCGAMGASPASPVLSPLEPLS